MNEQLQMAVSAILERAISGIDSSVEFMQAELPEVIEQLLAWYAVKGALLTIIGLVVVIVMVKIDISVLKALKKDKSTDMSNIIIAYGMCGCIARVLYLIPLSMMNLDWLQIWIAPKIWLMEYAAKLVN